MGVTVRKEATSCKVGESLYGEPQNAVVRDWPTTFLCTIWSGNVGGSTHTHTARGASPYNAAVPVFAG